MKCTMNNYILSFIYGHSSLIDANSNDCNNSFLQEQEARIEARKQKEAENNIEDKTRTNRCERKEQATE